jgi:H+-transporting ATPase
MAPLNGDIENGDVEKDARRDTVADDGQDGQDMGEYGNLVRYISTYRDGRRGSTASGAGLGDEKPKKRHWWSRKAGGSEGQGFETPDDWLMTDMKAGLSTTDVEHRRKKTGWNELTTEKENLFLKFLGYFKGPVLYGQYFSRSHHSHSIGVCRVGQLKFEY